VGTGEKERPETRSAQNGGHGQTNGLGNYPPYAPLVVHHGKFLVRFHSKMFAKETN
jgi:hypothetical protein